MPLQDEHKPGCLLARLKTVDSARLYCEFNKLVPEDEVDVENGAIERDSHVTVLHGWDYGFDARKLQEFLKKQPPFFLSLSTISSFKKDGGSGVLKIDVISPQLEDLHYRLRGFFKDEVKVTFPEFHPHLTIAYLKAGAKSFDRLQGSTKFAGETYYFTELIFSSGTSAVRQAMVMPLGSLGESARQILGGVLAG